MIRAACETETLTLRVTGHAGAAPAGRDLICAGVSALVYALARTVEHWGEYPQIHLEPGDARIRTRAKEGCQQQLRGAFEMTKNGLELLARQFPEYVEIVCEI